MSKPEGPGVMRASIVVIWHTGQGGRWINMMLRLDRAGARHSQSPIVAKKGAVMEPACAPSAARRWSILLIHKNFTNANGEEFPFKSGRETSEGAPAPCLGGSEPYIASRLRALEAFFTKPTKYPTRTQI
jgi:hypothetical protein